jgi:hypothetical protein
MPVEIDNHTSEPEKQTIPRESLEGALAKEEAGSPAIEAISDEATRTLLSHKKEQKLSQWRATLPKDASYTLAEMNAVTFDEDLALAHVNETQRKRGFGKNAAAYENGQRMFNEVIWRPYIHEAHKQITDANSLMLNASQAILKDLKEINSKKSSR